MAKDSSSRKPERRKYFFHQLRTRRKDKMREGREERVREEKKPSIYQQKLFSK